MLVRKGFACVIRHNGQDRMLGPSKNSNQGHESLLSNGLNLFPDFAVAKKARAQVCLVPMIHHPEIRILWMNFRIAETSEEADLVLLQKTSVIIGLTEPNLSLHNCIVLGRAVQGVPRIADSLADLELNGFKSLCDPATTKHAYREYVRQAQTQAAIAAFSYKTPQMDSA